MPARNSIKNFVANGYYHIYNRGVEKRQIFMDDQDYNVFLNYVKEYLLPKDTKLLQDTLGNPMANSAEKAEAIKMLRMNNFNGKIKMLAYCLMPNHFHFLLQQTEATDIDKFTNSLFTRYTMYFNKRYRRIGKLFQGIYKAVLIENEQQLIHLTKYIHLNPCNDKQLIRNLDQFKYSSYNNYLGKRNDEWIDFTEIIGLFAKVGVNSYESFINENNSTEIGETLYELSLDWGEV